jgi:flagellar assembly protein FliH
LDKVGDLVIIQDDNMEKGDCIIETDSGNIDSGVQTQLEFVRATFEELLKSE